MANKNQINLRNICLFCKYFCYDNSNNRNLCYKGSILKILLFGPELAIFDSRCDKFEFNQKYLSKQKTR